MFVKKGRLVKRSLDKSMKSKKSDYDNDPDDRQEEAASGDSGGEVKPSAIEDADTYKDENNEPKGSAVGAFGRSSNDKPTVVAEGNDDDDRGVDDFAVPVNVKKANVIFESSKFDNKIAKFSNEIRLEHYTDKDVTKPFDDDDMAGLEDTRSMLEVLARIPIVIALVCLKVREEGLWRNQGFDSHFQCLCTWLNLKESSIRRYLLAGAVIALLIKERGISGLPDNIAPYIVLSKLEFNNVIFPAYDKAKEISKNGVITTKDAEKVVAGQERIGSSSGKQKRKNPKGSKGSQSSNTPVGEPESPAWKIEKNSQAIVKHVETVLKPTVAGYLSARTRKQEYIAKIKESLQAVIRSLDEALESNANGEE